MSHFERQVQVAQRRLWFNRWLRQWGCCLLAATCGWMLLWLTDRLFALKLPMLWGAVGGFGLSLVAASIWLARTREPRLIAAVALDRAAGLRERLSSSLHAVHRADDPFAQAVVADADLKVAGLSARKFIPIRWTGSLSASSIVLAVALLSLLLPEFDLLNKRQAQAGEASRVSRLTQARSALAKPVSALQEVAEKNPDLEINKDLKSLEDALKREHADPDVLRREAVKKLDRLQDALKQKADSDRFKALNETKKRLKQLSQPQDPKSEIGKLLESLTAGDFEQAQKSLAEMQEDLAKRAREGKLDDKQVRQMSKQLDDLSKKLEQAAKEKQSERELQNMGLSKAEAERILNALAKKDPQQIEAMAKELSQRLKDQGVSEQQIKDMLEKMKQRQEACGKCQELGSKLGQAGQQLSQGSTQAAMDELGEAGEMLNEMEQLEQALNDVESQMAELNEARQDLDQSEQPPTCQQCNGTGFRPDGAPCPHCNGTGQGPCGRGRGSGARQRNDDVETATENKKAKVKTRSGSIIGQQFVKGQQLKGQSQVEFYDSAEAAEIDAAEALNKDRVPRRYREGVKRYFDRLGDRAKPAGAGEPQPPADQTQAPTPAEEAED